MVNCCNQELRFIGLEKSIYYIDTSVLLENRLLVKFIRTTYGTRVAYFPYPH